MSRRPPRPEPPAAPSTASRTLLTPVVRRLLALAIVPAAACTRGAQQPAGAPTAGTYGLVRADGRDGALVAPTGTRPGARLQAALEVRPDTDLPAGALLVVDQGCRDGERLFRGSEVRYALPELGGDARVEVGGGAARGGVRALARDDGWFAFELARPVAAGERIGLALDVPTNPLPLELVLFAEVRPRDGAARRLPGFVAVRLADARADWLRVLLPAQAEPDRPLAGRVAFMAGLSGPAASSHETPLPEGTLELLGPSVQLALPLPPDPDPSLPQAVAFELPPLPPGTHRIRARWRESPHVEGISNPVVVGPAESVWFGTLHAHTAVGGHASGTPSGSLHYARDVARLDFLCLSEHRESPEFDGAWLRDLALSHTLEERFVVFNGYEWTDPEAGHRHVLFREPLAPAPPPPDLAALAASLGRDPDVLLVAHHPLWAAGAAQRRFVWGEPGALPRQRLAEAYSWHGSSLERASSFPFHGNAEQMLPAALRTDLISALQDGQRFFVVADGDNHLGKPGALIGVEWPRGRRYAFQGLTAAVAPRLERDALFGALDAGECYGTTGARLRLAARRTGTRCTVEVAGAAPLAAIELRTPHASLGERRFEAPVPAAQTSYARLFVDPAAGTWDARVEFELPEPASREPLLIGVTQHDHHAAWKLLAPPSW